MRSRLQKLEQEWDAQIISAFSKVTVTRADYHFERPGRLGWTHLLSLEPHLYVSL